MQIIPQKDYTLDVKGSELLLIENLLLQIPYKDSAAILNNLEARIKPKPVKNTPTPSGAKGKQD